MQLFPALDQLRIRSKLRLLLAIPLAALLFFAFAVLSDHYQDWLKAKNSQRYLSQCALLSSLIYELQIERRLSNPYMPEDTDLQRLKLKQQRAVVDQLLAQFRRLRSNLLEPVPTELQNAFVRVQSVLDKLRDIRHTIDVQTHADPAYFYKVLGDSLLLLIDQLEIQNAFPDISRLFHSYNALLRLNELAALESYELTRLISDQSQELDSLADIRSYHIMQQAELEQFDLSAPRKYQLLLKDRLGTHYIRDFLDFKQAIQEVIKKRDMLHRLAHLIGYDGLINQLKNYTIHGTPRYFEAVENSFRKTQEMLAKLRALPDITPEERRRLDIADSVLKKYPAHLAAIQRMHTQHYSVTDIGLQINVDDNLMLDALNQLTRFAKLSQLTLWQNSADFRQSQLRYVIKQIEGELLSLIRQKQVSLSSYFTTNLLLIFATLALTWYFSFRIKQRLSNDISNISRNMREFAHKAPSARILSVQGTDEIADMATSFNHLISELNQTDFKLRKSEENYHLISDLSPQQIWKASPDGVLTFVNQRVLDYFNCPASQLLENGWQQRVHPDDLPNCLTRWQRSLKTGCNYEVEFRLWHHSGRYRWHMGRALPQLNEKGEIIQWFGTNTDISERKQAEEKIKLVARVFSDAYEGIIITDCQPVIVDVNPVFSEITGYSREEVVGQDPQILSSKQHPAEFFTEMWQLLNTTGHWKGEIWNRKKNGELYIQLLTISAVYNVDGKVQNYIGLFFDITQIKRQQQVLEQMAYFDVLTGLPNRTLFTDRFKQAIARSKRENSLLAVGYMDLDGFKPINDEYGHEAGDQLLSKVAERLKKSLREDDTIARIGGDEFSLLLHLDSKEQCEQVLSNIHKTIALPYSVGGHNFKITASCGVTFFPWDDATPGILLEHADLAMYQAKKKGKNAFHFYSTRVDQQE